MAGDAVMVMVLGRVPLPGVTLSHDPEVVVAATVKGMLDTVLLNVTSRCTAADPDAAVRVTLVGLGVTVTDAIAFKTTSTLVGIPAPVPVSGVMVIMSVYVPGSVIPDISIPTERFEGVKAVVELRVTKSPDVVTWKKRCDPSELVTPSVC